MSDHWRVLVTGPVNDLDAWVAAAREAGWEGIPFPLIQVTRTGERALEDGAPLPDWVAVTSSNALAALVEASARRPELAEVPFVCVGEATAQRALELGLPEARIPAPGAQDAQGLVATLLDSASAGQRVLWPRGNLAKDLGARLKAAGLIVDAPVVYRTSPIELGEEPPEADAVFFASPSAVDAWRADERRFAPAAIAIGWTTHEALERVAERFSLRLPLVVPSLQAFEDCLRSFFPSE